MIQWVSAGAVIKIQQRMVAEFGGMAGGLRDKGLLESALFRPLQLQYYQDGKCTQYGEMAATYADGIIKNHPFFDANKRTGFQTMELFLGLNGMRLTADDDDCVQMICGLASNEIDLGGFGDWVKKNIHLDRPVRRPTIPHSRLVR
jgi:death-on-curing protein